VAGLAVCDDGLVIDVSAMRGVWVDPATRRARVQAGCRLGDVDRETQVHGLAGVMGFVSDTGVAGYTVGGGFGYLTRRFGWACDTLASAEVVTASGEVLTASRDQNPELFWCLRGGGGNFGVVTSFEYSLWQVGPQVYGGAIAWPGAEAPRVLSAYAELTAQAPRELSCMAALTRAPSAPWLPAALHGEPLVAVFVCHTGAVEDGPRLVAPLRALGKPVADLIVPRPYTQLQCMNDAAQPAGRRYYFKSEYLPGLEPRLLDSLIECAAQAPSRYCSTLLTHLHGALNELPGDYSPVGNRDAAYVVNVTAGWEAPRADGDCTQWARRTWEAVRPYSTGGVYLNFLSEDEGPERVAAAWGAQTRERLQALKRTLDPANLFRHTKGLG
jgi:FAD/FMN-containing dehydrogenase